MSRLVVVSNRVVIATDSKARAGGLAVALQDALQEHGGLWFGWSGEISAKESPDPEIVESGNMAYATLDLSRQLHNEYYNGYANRSLWPLFHYRIDLTAFSSQNYAGYREVNVLFANKLLPLLTGDDLIWVHDYHLIPLGRELREQGVDRPMGFFLHTPFPAMEVLTALPGHRELVRGLCAYDVVGFQTENDLRAFLDYIIHEAGGGIMGNRLIHAFGRTLMVDVFPIGIDTEEFVKAGQRAARSKTMKKLSEHPDGRTWVVGVDRLDYSKGLVQRFEAFKRLLELHPEFKNKVTLIQIAPPSRSEVPEYKEIRRSLEGMAGHINGMFGEYDWVPINYQNKSLERSQLAAFYRASRVGLITPLRDGMNLVAKEYVACQDGKNPGVLVLSRFAGAARELAGAVIVNPFDSDATAEAIAQALEMPLEERQDRWQSMMAVLNANTLTHWRDNFLAQLQQAPFSA